MSIDNIASAFFTAIERGDVKSLDKLYADDVAIWHNFSGKHMDKQSNIALLAKLNSVGVAKYSVQEKHVIGDRLLRRHLLEIVTNSGQRITIPAAIFMTIRDGRITSIDEYIDSAHIVPGLM